MRKKFKGIVTRALEQQGVDLGTYNTHDHPGAPMSREEMQAAQRERAFGMLPKRKRKVQSEIMLHGDVVDFMLTNYPHVRFYSSLDGLNLTTQRARETKKRLRWGSIDEEGVGFPDLMIFVPSGRASMLVIELKALDGRPGPGQQGWLDYFQRVMGAKADFAYGYDDAIRQIKTYMRTARL